MLSRQSNDNHKTESARYQMGRYKVRKLMKEAKLYCKQPKARHFNRATEEQFELLNKLSRNFNPTSPHQVWTGDITYIWAGGR
jgi:putative transposase